MLRHQVEDAQIGPAQTSRLLTLHQLLAKDDREVRQIP